MSNPSIYTSQDLADRTEVKHKEGTATSGNAKVTLAKESGWLKIANKSASVDILFSLDGGTIYITIYASSHEPFNPCRVTAFDIKTNSGEADYVVTYGVEPS